MLLPAKNSPTNNFITTFDAHRSVAESRQFNFSAAQIQLALQLNPNVWDHHLQGYWDQQLKFLIRYSFPLDFDYSKPLRHENKNHQSAIAFKEDVSHYLAEECQFGAN